ncbi:MAG: hypothetical protein CVU46_07595 [Chloroflexi bacterium HGW-Chloroflexi-8]|nr:MAG: hypothetical protein CVU46_07595 [Chloroflexi bacterium HGW-Chloroflexi-8]
MSPIDQKVVQAFLSSMFYKYQNESAAKIIDLAEVKGIQYVQSLQQPWPRNFKYQLEFFAEENPPGFVLEIIQQYIKDNPEEYVLNVLSKNINVLIPGYKDIGFLHAWNNTIMLHKLSNRKKNIETSESVDVYAIKNELELANVNSLGPDYPVSLTGLLDPYIINLYATYNGEVGAKAQAVIIDPQFIYISDLFTHPDFRRKSLSAALLFKMHQIGLENGCKYSILLPSKMTRNFELFQKFEYLESVSFALLVPEVSPLPPGNQSDKG